MEGRRKFNDLNRQAWDQFTRLHVNSKFYDLDRFYDSRNSLNSTELEEIGMVKGKSLLHLQCHFGQDTLSFQNLGAQTVGIDISGESIKEATSLASRLGLEAKFIQSDIYDIDNVLNEEFDIIYTAYGVLFWLSDLQEWGEIIARNLKDGGHFYMVEFHPITDTFDEDFGAFKYPYFKPEDGSPIEFVEHGTYAEPESSLQSTTYGWPHSLDEVLSSLINAGLQIDFFHEFPFSHYPIFPSMIEYESGKFYHKEIKGRIPYMYSIMATKR